MDELYPDIATENHEAYREEQEDTKRDHLESDEYWAEVEAEEERNSSHAADQMI